MMLVMCMTFLIAIIIAFIMFITTITFQTLLWFILFVFEPMKFQSHFSKVDEQSDFKIVRLQIVDCLSQMNGF